MKRFFLIVFTLLTFILIPFLTSFLLGQVSEDNKILVNDAGKKIRIDREKFLISAVLSVSDEDFHDETLKALTTVFSTLIQYGDVDADSKRGVLLIDTKGIDEDFKNRVISAVSAAGDNVMLCKGEPIYSVFHKSSGGNTLESENVFEKDYSYLSSVSSDKTRGEQIFSKAYLEESLSLFSPFSITSMNDDGSANTVMAGDSALSGAEFRKKLGIIGSVFTLEETDENLYVYYSGEGHGVGLSIMGAESMAESGKTAEEILSHYYQGIEIAKII
jgi:stage II sporulation protein D